MSNNKRNQRFLPLNMIRSGPVRQQQTARRFTVGARQAMKELRSSSTLVNGPPDPRPISADIVLQKTFEYLPVGTGMITFTPSVIAQAFPGGPTVFTRFRLVKVSAYATAVAGSKIQVVMTDDEASFVDHGTQGSLRPQLHISPTFTVRNTWHDSADATSSLFIGPEGAVANDIVYQLTVELRSLPDVVAP